MGRHLLIYARFLSLCALLILCSLATSCQQGEHPQKTLLQAEELMNERPDSALHLLEDFISSADLSEKDYADWCLLITQARDKNYITHTSDSLIRTAYTYYEHRGNPERLMLTCYCMGRVSQEMNNAVRAQEYYLKALEVGESSPNHALKARICSNLGMLYTYQDAFDMALASMKKGLHYLELADDTLSQSYILRDIGRTYRQIEQSDSAEFYYKEALMRANQQSKSSILGELGGILTEKKEYEEALSYARMALEQTSSSRLSYTTYYILGKLYFDWNKHDSAKYFLTKSIESPTIRTKAGSYYHLRELAKQGRNWENYASLNATYEVFRDSIENLRDSETLQKMQALYNYQQIEKEAEAYKLQHAISQRNFYQLASVIILLIACLIGYVLTMRNRRNKWRKQEILLRQIIDAQKQKSEEQIALNQERIKLVEAGLIDALDKEKTLLSLKKKAFELENIQIQQEQQGRKLREEILKSSPIYLKYHVRNIKATEEDWATLVEAVDATYPNFIDKILQLYPSLDEYEKKLCYYTKIGLMNRQIAEIMVSAENTITMRRIRLHKKIFKTEGSADKFNSLISSL